MTPNTSPAQPTRCPAVFFFFFSFFLLHASISEPAELITASQSLRRFSRAESSRDSSSSSIENTCCFSIEDTEDPPERLPKVSPNATCG